MNRCKHCKVTVHPQHEFCPLCGGRLMVPQPGDTSFPPYAVPAIDAGFTAARLLLFLTIAASAVTVFVNVFTYDAAPLPWSAIVVLCLVFAWRAVGLLRTRKAHAGKKILESYLLLSAFLIALDAFSGFRKWSTTYVIPFLTIFVALVFTVLAVRGSRSLREYMGYLLAIFFQSLCPILIYLFSLSTEAWSSMVAILYCLLTVVGLVLFRGGSFRAEIKKRFHY